MTSVTAPLFVLGHKAAEYASRGFKVFPLWWTVDGVCACRDKADCGSPGKHPRVGHGGSEASAHPASVAAWWKRWPDAPIGLAAGGNGLAIIDIDPGKGGDDTLGGLIAYADSKGVDLMATWVVRTGSGGLHLYYRAPADGIKTATKSFGAPGVDTRGRGGYVVAPPSPHYSGGRYERASDPSVPLAPWPSILTPLMEAPRQASRPTSDGTGPARPVGPSTPAGADAGQRWALAGLRAECEALQGMRAGDGRNNALNNAAYKVGRKLHLGLDEHVAAAALREAVSGWIGSAKGQGGTHTEREINATIRSGLEGGKAKPHPGPPQRGQR